MSSLERDIYKICRPTVKDERKTAYPDQHLPERRNISKAHLDESIYQSQANRKCSLKRKISLAASSGNTCPLQVQEISRGKCFVATSSNRDIDQAIYPKKMHLDDPTQFLVHPNTSGKSSYK